MIPTKSFQPLSLVTLGLAFLLCAPDFTGAQQNRVMGEVKFSGATKIEKSSGVWIDGQYVGYLKELKGDKKIMLLPGQHEFPCGKPAITISHKPLLWNRGACIFCDLK